MDRRAWLAERRAAVEADYSRDAATYDDCPISELHRRFVGRVVGACPPGGVVLDIPCGTGRYFDLVVSAGRRVVGADQSSGMVAVARGLGLADRVEELGLQELAAAETFDGLMCIDALEHVPPEDWPVVVGNLARACRRAGLVYLTLELIADQATVLERAYADGLAAGLPIVPGEAIGEETGGYHFYPAPDQVDGWLRNAGLEIVDDASERTYGSWGYRHMLLRHVA